MSAATAPAPRARRPRVATPERWAAALARAKSNRLALFVLGGDARFWAVTSATRPGVAYTVSVVPGQPVNCICEAGRAGDPVCQHKAIVLDRLGLLPRPAAPVAAPAPAFAPRVAAGVNNCLHAPASAAEDRGQVDDPPAPFRTHP